MVKMEIHWQRMLPQCWKEYDIIITTILYLLLPWLLLRGVVRWIRYRFRSNRFVVRGGRFAREELHPVNHHICIAWLRWIYQQIKNHVDEWEVISCLRISSLFSDFHVTRRPVETILIDGISFPSSFHPLSITEEKKKEAKTNFLSTHMNGAKKSQLLFESKEPSHAASWRDTALSSQTIVSQSHPAIPPEEEEEDCSSEQPRLPVLVSVNTNKDPITPLPNESKSLASIHSSMPSKSVLSYTSRYPFRRRHTISSHSPLLTPILKRPIGESEDDFRPWKRISLPKTPCTHRTLMMNTTTHSETRESKRRRSIQDLWNEFNRSQGFSVDLENTRVSLATNTNANANLEARFTSPGKVDVCGKEDDPIQGQNRSKETSSSSKLPILQEQVLQNQLHTKEEHAVMDRRSKGKMSQPSTKSLPWVTNFGTTLGNGIQSSLRRRGVPPRSSVRGRSIRSRS
jgi:hypothetical protein